MDRTSAGPEVDERHTLAAVRKATVRLIPFLGLLYLVNCLDRVSVNRPSAMGRAEAA